MVLSGLRSATHVSLGPLSDSAGVLREITPGREGVRDWQESQNKVRGGRLFEHADRTCSPSAAGTGGGALIPYTAPWLELSASSGAWFEFIRKPAQLTRAGFHPGLSASRKIGAIFRYRPLEELDRIASGGLP